MPGPDGVGIERRERLLTSYAAGLAYLLVRAGQQLALLPAFLLAWGAGLYEQWILLSAAAAFIALADLGTRPYLHNKMLLRYAAGDREAYYRTFRVAMWAMLASMLFGISVLALGTWIASEAGYLGSNVLDSGAAAFVLFALGLRVLLDIPADIFGATHWARREVTRNITQATIWLSIELLGILLGLLLGLSPVELALIPLGIRSLFIAYWMVEVTTRDRALSLRPLWPTLTELRELLRLGLSYVGLPVAQLASFQGVVMVLAAVSHGPAIIVAFTAVRTIASLLRQILERIAGLTAAELARSYAQQHQQALARVYLAFSRLFGGLAGLLIGAAWVYAPSIVPILTAGKVAYEPAVLQFLLIGLMLGLPGVPVALLLHQINRPRPLLLISLAQIAVALLLTFFLGGPYGAAGAAAAIAIPEAFAGLVCLTAYGALVLSLPVWPSIARMMSSGIAAALLSAFVAFLTLQLIGMEKLADKMLSALAWWSVVALPGTFIMLGVDQRRWLYRTVRRVV